MLNKIVKLVLNKEIVLYNKHRQIRPLVEEPLNRKAFLFIEILYLWRLIPFTGKNKWKFRLMYLILNIISPKYILEINWISKWHSLYYLWCKNHSKSKFIVVQHGSYVGGVVTDIAHRYARCNVFLCWSDYFTDLFRQFNTGKKLDLITFGNTVYNKSDRDRFTYKKVQGNRILLAPSGIKGERLLQLTSFKNKLESLGFSVDLKEHSFQSRRFAEMKGFNKITENIYDILSKSEYDIVVSDHSSCLLDIIFFKHKVLFFSPEEGMEEYYKNIYSRFLLNIASSFKNINSPEDLHALVDIEAQEKLLKFFVSKGDNDLSHI